MRQEMTIQVLFGAETFLTFSTMMWLQIIVDFKMALQIFLLAEWFATNGAFKSFLGHVGIHVFI